MTLDEIEEGMPVLSIPRHAQGKRTHPDCQRGMVTGKTATHVLVRYGTDRHSNATAPAFLVPDATGAPGLGGLLLPPDRSDGARRNVGGRREGSVCEGAMPAARPAPSPPNS